MKTENIRSKILFISSGATISGVPVYFINMINWFKSNTDFDITILTAFGGPLENEYAKLAPAYRWDDTDKLTKFESIYLIRLFRRIVRRIFGLKTKTFQEKIISKLSNENFDLIYINSVCSLWIFEQIRKHIQSKTLIHVHELQMSILQFCGSDLFKRNIPYFDRVIVISDAVKSNLENVYNIPQDLMSKVYTFVDNNKSEGVNQEQQRKFVRDQLGIPGNAIIIASSGTTDWRKGADLVVQIAKRVHLKSSYPVHFIWIGGDNKELEFQKLYYDVVKLNLQTEIHFLGIKENILEYIAAADIFMLASREEPVGIVALEAASLGKPILCFEHSGGMPEFVERDCGFIIPYLDLDSMAEHIILLCNDRSLRQSLGENALRKVKQHDINIACRQIEGIINSTIN